MMTRVGWAKPTTQRMQMLFVAGGLGLATFLPPGQPCRWTSAAQFRRFATREPARVLLVF